MPVYVYGCKDKEHPRETLTHGMFEVIETYCTVCGGRLHKIPQPFLWGTNPLSLIRAWSERNWAKKLRGEPREQSYDSIRTDTGKAQKNYESRK